MEIQENTCALVEAEQNLRREEQAGNVDRGLLGLVRDVRILKEKNADLVDRIDAIAEADVRSRPAKKAVGKSVGSGNKK